MFASKGAQPGAILVQWNIKQGSQGGAGMWDSHFRVGGTTGSNLQVRAFFIIPIRYVQSTIRF